MAVLEIRQRAGYLFVAVIVGHIILISAQVNAKSGVPVLEQVTFGLFAEVQRGASAFIGGVRHTWTSYVTLRGVKSENETLKRELADIQVQLQEQRALADRSRSLERLLELRDRLSLQTAAAEIIAASATPDFRTVTIDKGSLHGLKADMGVMAPAGVVGRVVTPTARASKVQLLVDRNAAAGVLIERSRAQGVALGSGDDRLRLEYVAETGDVVVGDVVVTSGIDGIYPKGLVVGRVESVDKNGAYRQITVRPAVDFSSLEEVLVILTPTAAKEATQETAR
jgi:rod shape-determining protein MreC